MADQAYRYSTCQGAGCRRLILWVLTEGGKRMPVDHEPRDDGNVIVTRLPDGTVRGRVLTGDDLPAEGRIVYVPHHRTCPDAAEFRRRKPVAGIPCGLCREPMDPWLSDHGYARHIGCLPPIDGRQAAATHERRPA